MQAQEDFTGNGRVDFPNREETLMQELSELLLFT